MSSFQNSNVIAAAIGATIGVVSVAAVFIYHKVMERQNHEQYEPASVISTINSNVDRVSRRLVELEAELEALRLKQQNLQKSRRKRGLKKRVYSDDTFTGTEDVDIDTYSTAGTDFGDDEFFDCSDDEEEEDVTNGTIEGRVNSEFLELDKGSEDVSTRPGVYKKLKALIQENPDDVEIIWRYARACYHCSVLEPEKLKEYIYEGLAHCEKVLHVRNGNLYKWYAILTGTKSKLLPTKGRIQYGYVFKEYVEKAIELLPGDNFLQHLMGRFQYEVSELSWIERKVAKTLFAEVPSGTYEDAIKYFEAAEKLSLKPHFENKLFLGKAYIAVGRPEMAVKVLSQLKDIPISTEEEREVYNEAQKLLKNYSEY